MFVYIIDTDSICYTYLCSTPPHLTVCMLEPSCVHTDMHKQFKPSECILCWRGSLHLSRFVSLDGVGELQVCHHKLLLHPKALKIFLWRKWSGRKLGSKIHSLKIFDMFTNTFDTFAASEHCLVFTMYPSTLFQTQPVPNPISYYIHRSPWWFHRFETLSNHLIELIFPFFTFFGRRMCMVNGVIQILFQVPPAIYQPYRAWL